MIQRRKMGRGVLRGLTLHRPWSECFLLADNPKRVENRSWMPNSYVNRACAPLWLRDWVASGWLVFNAPRPLPGCARECWDFRHGTFYTAVNLTMPLAERVLEEIKDLDGWQVVLVDNVQIRKEIREHLMSNGLNEAEVLSGFSGWPEMARAGGWPWYEENER